MDSRSRKCREAALARWATKEFRDKMKKITSSLAYKKKMSKSVSRAFSSSRRRKARSIMTKSLWKRSSYRNKVVRSVARSRESEDVIKRVRRGLKKSWTPERRKETSSRMLKEWKVNNRERTLKNRIFRGKIADRSKMTRLERLFDQINASNSFGFRFTGAEKHIAGNRTPDFVDEKNKLAIEIYGNQHKSSVAEDKARIEEIKLAGWKVLIIWNDEIKFEKSKVVAKVNRFVSKYR